MMNLIIQTFWLLLPSGFANMSPVLFRRIPFLNYPIDFGKKAGGVPIFGENKTYRGFFFGILIAILIVFIQKNTYTYTGKISLINYLEVNVYLLGFLLGFGALFGDLIKSFFKRRVGIKSGKSWPLFDQIDWVIGSLLFANFYITISWEIIIISILLFGALHPIINLIGYYLGIKKNKF